MNLQRIWVILLTEILHYCLAENSKNILAFFGGGSYSHKSSLWPLITALADRGHNVTVLSGFKNQPSKHPKVHDLFSHAIFNMTQGIYPPDRFSDRLQNKHTWVFDTYLETTLDICKTIMEAKGDSALDYVINEGKFDLVIDNTIYGDCGVIVAHEKKSKLVLYFACFFFPWFHDEFGFPDEFATIPNLNFDFSYPMNFWQRFKNYLSPMYWYITRRMFLYPQLEEIMQKRYNLKSEDVPRIDDIYRNADLALVSSHHSYDFARSVPPFFVSIGGMQCFLPTEPLSGEFKTILDEATDGAVLVVFGSTINLATMPPEIKSSFFAMMRKFPKMLFIWRWVGPEPEEKPENAIISKWLPQFQILGHPNLKAFISHAGLNSISEATYHGVPVILIPLFADQSYNGYRIEASEVGIRLEIGEVNSETLVATLNNMLNNPKYSTNMKTMSALFRDRPMNPIETAVYWTEFVLRHNDTRSLKPMQYLTFFQRRFLDAALIGILFVSFCFSLVFSVIFRLVRKLSDTSVNGGNGIEPKKNGHSPDSRKIK